MPAYSYATDGVEVPPKLGLDGSISVAGFAEFKTTTDSREVLIRHQDTGLDLETLGGSADSLTASLLRLEGCLGKSASLHILRPMVCF